MSHLMLVILTGLVFYAAAAAITARISLAFCRRSSLLAMFSGLSGLRVDPFIILMSVAWPGVLYCLALINVSAAWPFKKYFKQAIVVEQSIQPQRPQPDSPSGLPPMWDVAAEVYKPVGVVLTTDELLTLGLAFGTLMPMVQGEKAIADQYGPTLRELCRKIHQLWPEAAPSPTQACGCLLCQHFFAGIRQPYYPAPTDIGMPGQP